MEYATYHIIISIWAKWCPVVSTHFDFHLWFIDYDKRIGWSMIKLYLNSVLGHKLMLILSLHGAGFFISNLHIKCNCHYFSLNIIFRDYESYIIKKYASYSNYIQIKWWLIWNDTGCKIFIFSTEMPEYYAVKRDIFGYLSGKMYCLIRKLCM